MPPGAPFFCTCKHTANSSFFWLDWQRYIMQPSQVQFKGPMAEDTATNCMLQGICVLDLQTSKCYMC